MENLSGHFWKTSLNMGKRMGFYHLLHKHRFLKHVLILFKMWTTNKSKVKMQDMLCLLLIIHSKHNQKYTKLLKLTGSRSCHLYRCKVLVLELVTFNQLPFSFYSFHTTTTQSMPYKILVVLALLLNQAQIQKKFCLIFYSVCKNCNLSAVTGGFANG